MKVARWKRQMPDMAYETMIRRVSLVLFPSRDKVYEG